MRRVIAIAVGAGLGASLGGCSSFSVGDYFKSTPPSVQVQLESNPPGADAKTSLGPGCKTPCSVSVAAPEAGFSVQFTLLKFQPAVVDVKVAQNDGTPVTDPNPVYAELQPAGPPPKAKGTKPKSVKKKPQPPRRRNRRSPIRARRRSASLPANPGRLRSQWPL